MNRKITKEELISHVESLTTKCEEFMRERDEARRNLCLSEAADLSFGENGVPYHPSVARKIAESYGWDCFKENNDV